MHRVFFALVMCLTALAVTGCTQHMPERLQIDGGDDDAYRPTREELELPPTDDPCIQKCFDALDERIHAPAVDCSSPARPPASCFQPPRVSEVVDACEAICEHPAPADDCPGLVEELKHACSARCGSFRSPDVQSSCRRGCVREKFGPALPACTRSRLFR